MRAASALTPLLLVASLLAACGRDPLPPDHAPPTESHSLGLPAALAHRLETAEIHALTLDRSGEAYALVQIRSDSGNFLMQWADLQAVEVRQVLGQVVAGDGTAGFFHPTAPSPAVTLLDPAEAISRSGHALTVMNGAFFETPGQPTSQLAFPLARRGSVISGGSSPYGPGRPGAEDERWGQPLRTLGLDTLVHVTAYDPASGSPLGEAGFGEALVSYAPSAHPSRIATRFHVLGALDADDDGTTETLVAVTSDGRTRIGAAVSLLTRLGVSSETLVATDGGASVLVWNRRVGHLHEPAPAGGRNPQALPHYLAFALRGAP